MKQSFEEIKKELKLRNINLSHQRLRILEYLIQNQCHPTVNQIFTALQNEISTLSKTTVYNTLRILVDEGMVITIEDNETRYDIEIQNHGHFKCESCGTIFNFDVDIDALNSTDLKNFKINDKNVYFKGICPRCLSNIKENK